MNKPLYNNKTSHYAHRVSTAIKILSRHLDAPLYEDVQEVWRRTGHPSFTGSGVGLAVVSGTLVNTLTIPREANMDMIEIRSAY